MEHGSTKCTDTPPFNMGEVGKVALIAWKGACQVTFDRKRSGFHHVSLDPESGTHFGFGLEWRLLLIRVDRGLCWLVLASVHLLNIILGSRSVLD